MWGRRATRFRSIGRRLLFHLLTPSRVGVVAVGVVLNRRRGGGCGIRSDGRYRGVPILV